MSEVKPVHRYKAQTLFSFGGAKIEYFPHGPEVVLATEFDAQRLRADTAEAERDALRTSKEAVEFNLNKVDRALLAAEQRIAKLETVLRSAVEWFDDGVGRSIAEFCKLQEMRAALNPNPEAESHE